MADLMNGNIAYEKLARQYKDFMAPAYRLKAQGNDLVSSLRLGVENLSLSLSLDAANSCSFTIANAYDREAGGFIPQVKNALRLGTILTAEIGYGSSLTLVFKGYISELSYEYQDYPVLSVTAMDVRRLMMDGDARTLVHTVKSYSAAFTEVMKRYQKICPDLVIDQTEENLSNVTQKVSDYAFVSSELAKNANREFFVLAERAYFRVPMKNEEPMTGLEWGKGLLSFSRNSMYHNSPIKVVGFDEPNKEILLGEAECKNEDGQVDVIPDHQPTVITQPDARDIGQVKTRAENEKKQKKQKTQGGSGVCVGLPEIVPGRYLALSGLDPAMDNKYYVKRVSHTLSGDGFTTRFTIGGWK